MLKNFVSELRQRNGMSKSELARKIDVCPSYVTRLEKNDIQPSGEVMFRIAHHFKCRIEDVFHPVGPAGKK
jgi:DNA-binding XRE family transcriptional regulator